jgi:uncharacterized protein YdaU (DUF1376 family)
MHYYQFNIGDYQSHTKHLSPTEDICYRRLLDFYYLHELPIQNDLIKITRLLCLNKEYLSDVESVLSEFFILTDDGWINHRANKEIEQYQAFSEAGKRGAAKRWSKDGDSDVIGGLSGGVPKANAKQETINIKHKPLNKYIPPIPAELLSEWLSVRKKKKAGDVTELVWKSLLRESEKLNWTPEQAVTYCCEKSWVNLDASWVKPAYIDKQASTLNAALSVFKPQYIAEQTAHIKTVGDSHADF